DHAEADVDYRRASECGRDPQPGLALLRLAQGRTPAAVSAIRRAAAAPREPLERIPFLPALIEILLAAGEIGEAGAACEGREGFAARFEMESLDALAAHARGAVLLAAGDTAGALGPLRRAFRGWQRVGAPYLVARIRVQIGRAFLQAGDAEGAALELD